jgi:Zn-dependent M28 family amino/carboxypeptidase
MRLGARESDITTQKFRGAENLVVKRQGRTDDTIILGAHHDFVDTGCGAIDNWSGIVALAHVYKSVHALEQRKTVLFVAFDNEEKGLVGSRAMANAIAQEDLPRYCAMINVDSLGLVQPFAMKNTSSPSLMKVAEDAASAMGMSFRTAPIDHADADSSAFLARRVPAITLAGLSSNWPSILHSKNDQKGRIDGRNVYLGYRLTLAVLNRIDEAPCDTFRK